MQQGFAPSSRRQAVLGVFWGTVERFATQGISLIVVLLLARILGPESYGLVTLAATFALLGQMLLGETFSQALVQHKTLEPAHVSSLFWTLSAAGVLGAALQWLLAGPIAAWFEIPALAPLLRALSPLLVLSALQAIPSALFKRELNFRALAEASATGTVLGGAAGVALAYSGFGPWSIVANLLIQNTVVTVAIWRRTPLRIGLLLSPTHLRDLWRFGQYTFLLRIAAFAANQSPRIIVGYLFGPAALGAFSLGLRIVEILYQLLALPAVNVAVPLIARVRDDKAQLERTILVATQMAAMISAPVFIALALLAPFAIPLVFGAKWTASVPIIQSLCAFGVVGTCGLIWGGIIAGLGRPDVNLMTTTTAAILSVSLLLLTAHWGLLAASLVFVIRGYLTLPFLPAVIARLTGIRAGVQYRAFVPIAAAVASMAVAIETAILALSGILSPAAMLAAGIASGMIAYALALFAIARPTLRLGVSFLSQLRPAEKTA